MNKFPQPIFEKDLAQVSWKKIYEREYGVQYSELAVSILYTAKNHFPNTSIFQVVVPGIGNNSAFYIDAKSWGELVEGLNKKYTSHVKKLEAYEKQFLFDGKEYVNFAKSISEKDLRPLSNEKLLELFLSYKDKQDRYSVFAWSAFILNNYVADRAIEILDLYIAKYNKENEKQQFHDALFNPKKRAAIMKLQYEIAQKKGKLTAQQLDNLYESYKWLACLDIHNVCWTKEEFRNQIQSFEKKANKKVQKLEQIAKQFNISQTDYEYLTMANRFVYIKDARDDYRRQGVFYAGNLFAEIGQRMGIDASGVSYFLSQEIIDFLENKKPVSLAIITDRKKGFVLYLNTEKKPVCLQGSQISSVLQELRLENVEEKQTVIAGRVASQGRVKGKIVIVHGVKDLSKVQDGDILVAVTTHPDYVSAMRKAAAIVTDEGGITSHAAIVAREFGIPCIVGCKNATKALKDGDMVEVDAVGGKVVKSP